MNSATANNIRAIIKCKCFKQGLLAEKAGYDPKAFSNMLNGRKLVTDIDIINIANALEVTPNDLFGIEDNKGD